MDGESAAGCSKGMDWTCRSVKNHFMWRWINGTQHETINLCARKDTDAEEMGFFTRMYGYCAGHAYLPLMDYADSNIDYYVKPLADVFP